MNIRVSKQRTPELSVSRAAVASGRADGKHVPPRLRELRDHQIIIIECRVEFMQVYKVILED